MAPPSNNQQQVLYDKAREVALKAMLQVESLSAKATNKYKSVRESNENIDEHCGIAFGIILTLFGGQFATTFAFVEAFQQTGFRELVENGRIINDQLHAATSAVKSDEAVDEDRDGTPDIQTLSQREALERRFQVFVRNVDPEIVQRALSALWISFLSASAAVKLKFAKVIALGASVGEFLERPLQKYLLPRLLQLLDPKYHRWAPSMIGYLCRIIGVSIAFRLNRVLATIATAIRGGDMILRNINAISVKKNLQFLTDGPADEMLALSVVGAGVYAQLFGPQSSMLLRLVLFPLAISESILTLWVAS